jgi:2-dehydro-3-deoxyglucarate aldolase
MIDGAWPRAPAASLRRSSGAAGIFALDAVGARQFRAAGFRFILLALDVLWRVRAVRGALQEVRA